MVSDKLAMVTDDGSYGTKGVVTDALKALIDSGEQYDEGDRNRSSDHDEICM